jgi:hypothetical protein
MKKTFVNLIFTTGVSIVGLTLYFAIIHKDRVLVHTILELFGANILIHFGLFLRSKFEIRNLILEHIIDISFVLVVLIAFGIIFKWFAAVPIWILIVSGILIYVITSILTISKIKRDTREINSLLEKIEDL